MKKQEEFPPGWDEERLQRALKRYEIQTEEETTVANKLVCRAEGATLLMVPNELVPEIRNLIARISA